jgi:hypothetical protein
VTQPLASQPEPEVVGYQGYVPEPCVLHPERVVEHPDLDDLPDVLRDAVEEWEERVDLEAEEAEPRAMQRISPLPLVGRSAASPAGPPPVPPLSTAPAALPWTCC